MTGRELLTDIYERVTSRKFILTVVSLGIAYWNYQLGALTAEQFQTAVWIAVTAYLGAEAVTDAAGALHSTPDTTVRTTVNTGTEAAPSVTTDAAPASNRVHDDPDEIYAAGYADAMTTMREQAAQQRRERDARRREALTDSPPAARRRPRASPPREAPGPVVPGPRRPRPHIDDEGSAGL
jgi:hypothetical protein